MVVLVLQLLLQLASCLSEVRSTKLHVKRDVDRIFVVVLYLLYTDAVLVIIIIVIIIIILIAAYFCSGDFYFITFKC